MSDVNNTINLRKILYPTDFSKHSLAALPHALSLSQQYHTELHCLHVVDETYQYWVAGTDNAVPTVISDDEIMDSARQQMDEFIANHLVQAKDQLVSTVIPGRPFVEIIRYAKKHEIDLIVIATHGHGALASMLLGSVTEKVVRKAPCPVLTVRQHGHKFEMP